jgi:hypothetical protein
MLDASMALASNRDDHLAVPWMERIKDLNFKRRAPGIMTLVRQEMAIRASSSPVCFRLQLAPCEP